MTSTADRATRNAEKRTRRYYGVNIGLILSDVLLHRPVGDSGNARSYDYPVAFTTAYGADTGTLLYKKGEGLLPIYIEAGRSLLDQGVRAVSTSCGFTAILQEELADELDGVVASSAMLQIPFALRMLGKDKHLGVIAANAATITDEHFRGVGVTEDQQRRLYVTGLEHTEFLYPFLTTGKSDFDLERGSKEMIDIADQALEDDPAISGFILECTGLPPYSDVLRQRYELPVWDVLTMLNWVNSGFSA